MCTIVEPEALDFAVEELHDFEEVEHDVEIISLPEWFGPQHDRLLDAIALVESNRDPNAVGDGGKAQGYTRYGKSTGSMLLNTIPPSVVCMTMFLILTMRKKLSFLTGIGTENG